MNKMAKGALAIGIGSAMLLGGGGTLAVWNETQNANAGQIAAGTLDLEAKKGVWTSNGVEIPEITKYKVVPGETLTYTQPLTVNLAGDKMQANLTVDTSQVAAKSNFAANDLTYSTPTLKSSTGAILPSTILTPASGKDITASVSITFNNTVAQSSINATANLDTVTYKLNQVAPGTATPAPAAG